MCARAAAKRRCIGSNQIARKFYYVNYSGHLRDADSVAPTPLTVNHRRCDAIARRIDRVGLFERSPLDFLASMRSRSAALRSPPRASLLSACLPARLAPRRHFGGAGLWPTRRVLDSSALSGFPVNRARAQRRLHGPEGERTCERQTHRIRQPALRTRAARSGSALSALVATLSSTTTTPNTSRPN